jgi:Vitamin K epoxide reductase family
VILMQNLEQHKSAKPLDPERSSSRFQIKGFDEFIGNPGDFERAVELYNYKIFWTYAVNCILGLWLITSPHLYDYESNALAMSDIISGSLIILFEFLSFSPRLALLRWCTAAVGFWLLLAPLIFWSPTPATYLIDTVIACFVITFAILIPGVPGRAGVELPGPDQPPGWTYNPSSWIRRWLGIALALLGFFISRYLAAHQLGYIPHAFDPFFGNGSDRVLTSTVSKSFPISDAGFGSVAYVMEVLTGFMGNRARWRTTPWIVVMFALLVLPLGVTSIILVITQPIVVGSWCGLCLIAATGLLISVPLSVHEAIAVGQFLVAAKAQNKNFWRIFWMGGTTDGAGGQDPDRMRYTLLQRWIASVQGVTVPWTLFLQVAIGAGLMARPDLFPFDRATANCDHLIGALVVTVAIVATAEVTRIARLINISLGAALIVAALVFARGDILVLSSELISGLLLVVLSIPRGEIIERYAGWDRFVK